MTRIFKISAALIVFSVLGNHLWSQNLPEVGQNNFDDGLLLNDFIDNEFILDITADCNDNQQENFYSYFRFSVVGNSNLELIFSFEEQSPENQNKSQVGAIILYGPFSCAQPLTISDINEENLWKDKWFDASPENSPSVDFESIIDEGIYVLSIRACQSPGPNSSAPVIVNIDGNVPFGAIDCGEYTICDWFPQHCDPCVLYPETCDDIPPSIILPPCSDEFTTTEELNCPTCIGSFAPLPGESYQFEAWVSEENATPLDITYQNPKIRLRFFEAFDNQIGSDIILGTSGPIIEEWQQISETVVVPESAVRMEMELYVENGNAFFDDIRVSPFNSAMKSYVYDQQNMRLIAELDERNFATLYQYDEEGRLVGVQKETSRGIKTIQAVQQNTAIVHE